MQTPTGKQVSFWIDSTPKTDFPSLQEGVSVDVAVLGGGITGITAATLLKRAGKTVALIESDRVVEGVTGHTTAKVTASHGQIYAQVSESFGEDGARLYGQSNQAAIEMIAGFVEQEGIDCDFSRLPNYLYSVTEDEVPSLRAEAEAAARAGLPASFVREIPLPVPAVGAVRFDDQAQFHPRKYLLHLASTIPGDGSYVFERTRATGVTEGSPCRVETEKGIVEARDVVVATLIPFLDRGLFFSKVHPYRNYVVCPSVDPATAPPGMFVSTESPTHTLRSSPFGDRALLIIAGEGHKVGQEDELERYRRLEEWTKANFEIDAIEYRWSTQDYYSIDHVPYIGKLRRGSQHVYVATGYNAWGLTTGTHAASILSDAILGIPNPWAELYDSNRLKPGASFRKFTEENINVAKRWFGDRIAPSRVKSVAELGTGEAGVLTVEGKRVAAYRDDQGQLHAVSAVCTHLACIVSWNGAERTWDCPCHGSRFSFEGEVVQGPAVAPLEPVELGDA